jgi:hypothetical protein
MTRLRSLVKLIVFSTIIIEGFPHNAYAYLDAGTGSYIIQLILATLIGGLFAIKLFWKKITNSVKKLLFKEEKHKSLE